MPPKLVARPVVIEAAGNVPKRIEEYAGRPSTGTPEVSVARMRSPAGWVEPGQRPEFREITVVLAGALHVEHDGGTLVVRAGQAVITEPTCRVPRSRSASGRFSSCSVIRPMKWLCAPSYWTRLLSWAYRTAGAAISQDCELCHSFE